MDYAEFMKEAVSTVGDRGKNYGDVREFLTRVVQIFHLMTGVQLTTREAAMFMTAFKLTRTYEDPHTPDHYVDGVNYLAFAHNVDAAEQAEAASNVPESPLPYRAPTPIKPLNLAERGERAVSDALNGA